MAQSEDWTSECNNFNDFELEVKDKFKGETPIDIKKKCLTLCQTYLGGKWTELSVDDIQIRRRSGGMSNQVYYCGIPEPMRGTGDEPQEVAVRLYGFKMDFKTFDEDCPRKSDAIVWLMASERGLGPKVYGLFPEGQIHKFYQCENFTVEDLQDKYILDQLADKLAQFQAMEPQLARNRNWGKNFFDTYAPKAQHFIEENRALVEEYNCQSLLDCDMIAIKDWILERIESSGSPTVFTVTDFRFPNFLISKEKKVVLNDFEFSDYYYRGVDFALLFLSYDKTEEKEFVFKDESIVKAFISRYIEENERIFGKQFSENPNNSVKQILNETKVFTPFIAFFLVLIMVLNEEVVKMPVEPKMTMTMANALVSKILATKKVMTADIDDNNLLIEL